MPERTDRNAFGLPIKGPSPLVTRIDVLRKQLRVDDPGSIASKSGTSFQESNSSHGEFCIPFLGFENKLSWPELEFGQKTGRMSSLFHLAFLLYYLATSDGTALTGNWVDFGNLPGGRIYAQAFHGYTGQEMVKKFKANKDSFEVTCVKAGGRDMSLADASFKFNLLPRLPLLVVYWQGDAEFSASCNILFDSSATHYLPIDACAIAGSMLVHQLIGDDR